MPASVEIEKLRAENSRLIILLEQHGTDWRLPEKIEAEPEPIG